jgi:hypothetical protein
MRTIIIARTPQVGTELARRLGMKHGTFEVPNSVEQLKGVQNVTIILVDGWDQRKDVSVPDMKQVLDTVRLLGGTVYKLSPVSKVK